MSGGGLPMIVGNVIIGISKLDISYTYNTIERYFVLVLSRYQYH
jgi:hypothetical protein